MSISLRLYGSNPASSNTRLAHLDSGSKALSFFAQGKRMGFIEQRIGMVAASILLVMDGLREIYSTSKRGFQPKAAQSFCKGLRYLVLAVVTCSVGILSPKQALNAERLLGLEAKPSKMQRIFQVAKSSFVLCALFGTVFAVGRAINMTEAEKQYLTDRANALAEQVKPLHSICANLLSREWYQIKHNEYATWLRDTLQLIRSQFATVTWSL